jgi:type I restriction enzyme S subunit
MIWKESNISEISRIGDGAHASLKRIKSGIPYLTAKNITKMGIDYSNMDYISEQTYNKYFRDKSNALTKPQKDDILYSIIGSIGGVYVVRNEKVGISSSVAIFRTNSDVIMPHYLAYFLKSPFLDAQVQAIKGGVAQGFISLEKLGSISILYPEDIEYQKKIVDILFAYDALIENNQKQIKLLEEAAQRIYKEWFIDLHFPGYEATEIFEDIPNGWDKKKISDLGEIITGKTPSTAKKQYYGGHIPFVKIPDMHDCIYPIKTELSLTTEGANTQKNKFVPKNGIMVSCIATVGLVNIAVEPCQTNQQINSIILNDEKDLYYIYSTMKRLKGLLEGIGSNGATMTNVNKTKFGNLEVLYPSEDLRKAYYDFCKPIFEEIYTLSVKISELSQARDCLLPKLMSGELEV